MPIALGGLYNHRYKLVFMRLFSLPFMAYVVSQMMTALNDNAYRFFLTLQAAVAGAAAAEAGSTYLLLTMMAFMSPFILFSGWAGYLSDRFSKRRVFIVSKIAEVIIALALIPIIIAQSWWGMIAGMFLLASQSAFMSPAKYGILPEFFSGAALPRATGVVQLTTFLSILGGMVLGGLTASMVTTDATVVAPLFFVIALVGLLLALVSPRPQHQSTQRTFSANPWREIVQGLVTINRHHSMRHSVVGMAFTWFFATLLTLLFLWHGKNDLGWNDVDISLLNAYLALGSGVGSAIAGWLMGAQKRLGFIPFAMLGLTLTASALGVWPDDYTIVASLMAVLGFFGGLFYVPLLTHLQRTADVHERGRLMACNAFMCMLSVLVASIMMTIALDVIDLTAIDTLRLFAAASTLLVIYFAYHFMIDSRIMIWRLVHPARVMGDGYDTLFKKIDQSRVVVCAWHHLHDPIHLSLSMVEAHRIFVAQQPTAWPSFVKHLPIEAVQHATQLAAKIQRALDAGERVCVFVEPEASKTGQLIPFAPAMIEALVTLQVPVATLFGYCPATARADAWFHRHLHGVRWRRRNLAMVMVPESATLSHSVIRQYLQVASVEAVRWRAQQLGTLAQRFVSTARRRMLRTICRDHTGRRLRFISVLAGALVLKRFLRQSLHGQDKVAVLLPPSCGTAVVMMALTLSGRTLVPLNYTLGYDIAMNAANRLGCKTIITAQAMLDKLRWVATPNMILVDTVREQIGLGARLLGLFKALVWPRAWCVDDAIVAHAPAAILLSSGTTAEPKAIALSHAAIVGNVLSILQSVELQRHHVGLATLPLFHSFGFTATWALTLVGGLAVVYHTSPLETDMIASLAARHRPNILFSTSTFCRLYAAAIPASDFASLQHVLVGAEKLQPVVAASFKKKFNIDIDEGYGCTELGPVVCVNRPSLSERQIAHRASSVGHPLTGVAARVIDVDTHQPLASGQVGMLCIMSAAQLSGYDGQPDLTHKAHHQGWYLTGDMARIDEDGFITIVDRLARFSKIGGEMVPHGAIEQAIQPYLPEGCPTVVVSAQDPKRGELLVLLVQNDGHVKLSQIVNIIAQSDLPNLWRPRPEHVFIVPELPLLLTGKLDLRRCQQMGRQLIAERMQTPTHG